MTNPRLTETFIEHNPVGTRIRHPLHGVARIAEIGTAHVVVEWESPMAKIEQPTRIGSSELPYMTRIVEVRSPTDARAVFAKQQYDRDHDDGIAVQEYVTRIERIIDSILDNPESSGWGDVTTNQNLSIPGQTTHTVTIPIVWRTRTPTSTEVCLNNVTITTMYSYHSDEVMTALKQYYGSHGWSMTIDSEKMILSHALTNESVKPKNSRGSVNKTSISFKGALLG